MKKLLNPSFALCATLFFAAHAPAQTRPAPTKRTPPTPAQVKPTPTPIPTPAPTPAPEPFDGASEERMAAQCVRLETESGTIEMKMLPDGAPETVRNFLNLAATGAYDTTTFSRVVRGFVIQGGNLSTREKLTPALAERARRTVRDEPNAVRHTRGVVSMARSDRPHSATTHFFILVGNASHLDNKFAVFGRVTKGMDVVDAINKAALEGETPLTPVRVGSAVVFACATNTAAPEN